VGYNQIHDAEIFIQPTFQCQWSRTT